MGKWLTVVGIIIIAAGLVDATGNAPAGMVILGVVMTLVGAFLLYKKYFAKF